MFEIFKSVKCLENSEENIFHIILPESIMQEVDEIVKQAKNNMSHPLALLKQVRNAGNNRYQSYVSRNLLNDSFLYPYIVNFAMYVSHLKGRKLNDEELHNANHNLISIQEYSSSSFNQAFWVNIAHRGSSNQPHRHSGNLSGVIYYKNDVQIPTKFYLSKDRNKNVLEHNGNFGEMLLFPSDLLHSVDEMTTDDERITLSFNLVYNFIKDNKN